MSSITPPNKPYGQIAFEAYTATKKGKTYDNKPIPEWEELSSDVRAAWAAAAEAAVREHLSASSRQDSKISVTSVLGASTLRPSVQIKFGEHIVQLPIKDAESHALNIISCAQSAMQEALMMRFLTERIGVEQPEKLGAIIADFRRWRSEYDV